MKNKKRKSVIIAICAVVIVLIAAGIFYFKFAPNGTAGKKTISITVSDDKGNQTSYDVKTDAEYLRGAMDDADGLKYSGEESEYGLMVDTVNDLRADYNKDGAFWSFTVNGENCNYGIDTQPVKDGDKYTIDYTLAK